MNESVKDDKSLMHIVHKPFIEQRHLKIHFKKVCLNICVFTLSEQAKGNYDMQKWKTHKVCLPGIWA